MEEFIKEITKKAGKAILEKYGQIGVKYTKSNIGDVVTEADLIANRIIVGDIKEKYPGHGIISEEEKEHPGEEYIWIIDPLDGTRNFATHTPIFGVMVALAKEKEIILATIYDPINDDLFFAKKGLGAFRNDQTIHCSQTKEWTHSFGCASGNLRPNNIPFMAHLVEVARKEPVMYSSFLCAAAHAFYVADGRRDWYFSAGGYAWDYAASSLIMSEAGCKVTDLEGKPWSVEGRSILAANQYLYPRLLELAQRAYEKEKK